MVKYKGKRLILNIVLVLVVVPLLIGQAQPSQPTEADIFFLDLGIAIEPPTGKEAYSRLIEAPSQEIKIKIKKAESGAIYMAASQEMLELLKSIQERVDQLEETFSKEVDLIQSENKEIKDIIAVITNPPLRKPERPEVFIPANNSFVDDSSFEDVTIETVFSVLEMPPLMLLPKQSLATPQQQFSQLVYMSAVFAYQREEYKEALNYFLALSFTGANQWTVGNVLYWMADCYRQGKEYNSALIMLDKLLVMENPGRATDALIQKGLIYRTLGKEELAMIMFRDLLDDYPESDYARLVGMELNSVELY